MKKLLSVREAAALLSCTEKALYQRILRKEFPARRWGRRVFIVTAELERFVQALDGTSCDEALAKVEQQK